MDKTNKITITCPDWEKRTELSQAVADLLGINMLDIDDFIIRGSVMNGDIDEYSKEEFVGRYGAAVFGALENISYMAYVNDVEEPFVISLGNCKSEGNIPPFKKTISIHVPLDEGRSVSSEMADYSIKAQDSISSTAKAIADAVISDYRWAKCL